MLRIALKKTAMNRIFTLLFICLSYFSYSQISAGNNQTICLGDTAQIIATTSVQGGTDSYQIANIAYAPEAIAGTPISLFDDDVQESEKKVDQDFRLHELEGQEHHFPA